jgi:hypothetical protein
MPGCRTQVAAGYMEEEEDRKVKKLPADISALGPAARRAWRNQGPAAAGRREEQSSRAAVGETGPPVVRRPDRARVLGQRKSVVGTNVTSAQ